MAVETAKAPAAAGTAREQRKTEVGRVVSAKMQKTIVVTIDRVVRHPKFEKQLTRQTILYAHDEKSEARRNDIVEIAETRPLSKLKRWRLVKIVSKAFVADVTGAIDTTDASKVKGGHKGKTAKKDDEAKAPAKAEGKAPAKPEAKAEKKG
jgi:small subunit ribosomal protein S17